MLLSLQLINDQLLKGLRLRRRSKLSRPNLLNVAIDIVLNWVESDGSEDVEELGELLGGGKEGRRVDGVVLVGVDWDVDKGRFHLVKEGHFGVIGYDVMELIGLLWCRKGSLEERRGWSDGAWDSRHLAVVG